MKTRTKILITILLAILCFLISQYAQAEEQCLLQTLYQQYNDDYFLGQLPKNANVQWADLGIIHDMGESWVDETGRQQIRIDRKTNPVFRQAAMTLLHEQCHIKTLGQELDQHGIKWQACMVDFANHGAMHDLW